MALVSEVVDLFPCKESGGLGSLYEARPGLLREFWEAEWVLSSSLGSWEEMALVR